MISLQSSFFLANSLQDASTFAPQENALFTALVVASSVVLGILVIANGFFIFRYRRGAKADRSILKVATWKIEFSWTIATTVIFLGFFFWGTRIYLEMERPPEGSTEVTVTARQWMWDVRYSDGRREFNSVHVLIGQPVKLLMNSEDVIHSFFVPAFRVKQDVVPGKLVTAWFIPTQTGEFPVFCAQYCGSAHSQMIGRVIVMTQKSFAAWESSILPQHALAELGKRLFVQYACSGCHGTGSAVSAPSLSGAYGKILHLSNGTFVKADDSFLHDAILTPKKDPIAGYPPVMPNYENVLRESDVLALIAYVKTLPPSEPVPGSASVN